MVTTDPATVGSSDDSKVLDGVIGKVLDGCYPLSSYLAASLKQEDGSITDAQVSCILGKLGPSLSWASVTQDSDAFESQLESAATACGAAV